MEDILSVIKNYAPQNKDITNRTYALKVNKALREGLDLDDAKSTLAYLKKKYTKKTYKSYITSIIVYRKALGSDTQDYDSELKKANTEIEQEYDTNKASPKEASNTITRYEIGKLIEYFDSKLSITVPLKGNVTYFDRFQQYLVLNLYYLIPPLRNDYVNLEVHEKPVKDDLQDTEKNYIFLSKKQLVLNRYKTSKAYGKTTIDLPSELVGVIREWIKSREIIYPQLVDEPQLLITRNLTPMNQVNLTQYLNRIFGRNISTTMLRKSYLSEKYPVIHSKEEMKKDAKAMQHSVETQQTVYRKK